MEQNSYKPLYYRHISDSATEALKYIDNRRKGFSDSLRTKWKKFNNQCMGGIEPNSIYTVAGISGSGKSAFLSSLQVDLVELNPKANFVILNLTFEMLASKVVGRKLSYKLNKTTQELYSGFVGQRLSSDDYNKVVEEADKIREYPIYYVDIPGDVDAIYSTVRHFSEHEGKGKWIIVTLDHTALTKNKSGEGERETIMRLQKMLIELRKYSKNTIIQLSQMNRDIEDKDRLTNHTLHYPTRRDIYGSDSVFQSSDYVMVLHRPEVLGLKAYGINNMPTKDMVYLHFCKNREGKLGIISFKNNLQYSSLDEWSIEDNNS